MLIRAEICQPVHVWTNYVPPSFLYIQRYFLGWWPLLNAQAYSTKSKRKPPGWWCQAAEHGPRGPLALQAHGPSWALFWVSEGHLPSSPHIIRLNFVHQSIRGRPHYPGGLDLAWCSLLKEKLRVSHYKIQPDVVQNAINFFLENRTPRWYFKTFHLKVCLDWQKLDPESDGEKSSWAALWPFNSLMASFLGTLPSSAWKKMTRAANLQQECMTQLRSWVTSCVPMKKCFTKVGN